MAERSILLLFKENKTYTKMATLDSKITQIIEQNPMFKSFRKYFNQDQEGKNDYEKGCIQTTNAMMPLIVELIIQLEAEK